MGSKSRMTAASLEKLKTLHLSIIQWLNNSILSALWITLLFYLLNNQINIFKIQMNTKIIMMDFGKMKMLFIISIIKTKKSLKIRTLITSLFLKILKNMIIIHSTGKITFRVLNQ